jgi:cytochrome c oxidase subunit IV
MIKFINFAKSNIISVSALGLYFIWWAYLLLDFANKDYDNHYAGAAAVEGMAMLTIALIIICTVGFLIAGFITKNWKRYLLFISVVYVPVIITLISLYFSH